MTQICSVEGCTEPAWQRGWCSKHYFRWYRYGSMNMPASRIPNPGPCAVDGCTRPGPYARGWCEYHYGTWRRRGDPCGRVKFERDCTIPGCDRVARAKGLCIAHYERMRKGLQGEALAAPFSPRPSHNHRNPCNVDGCAQRVYALGVCNKHYGQARRENRTASSAGRADSAWWRGR